MSNRLFQGVIHQMKDAVDRTFGVIDENFTIIACSELGRVGETVEAFPVPSNDVYVSSGFTYKSIGITQGANYVVFVEGEDVIASKYVSVIAVSFANIKFYYDEKYDRNNFIKNIILDNILQILKGLSKEETKITLKVNPIQVSMLKSEIPELMNTAGLEAKVLIVPDETVMEGGCMVTTTNGVIDATIETQLSVISEALKEI